MSKVQKPIERMLAENERLRLQNADLLAVLRRIVAGHPSESVSNPELWLSAIEMAQIARAAIAKAEGGEG